MAGTPWILISILVVIVLLAVVAALGYRKKKFAPDYYSMFVIGLSWTPLGIVLKNHALFIMGLVFMGAGLAHKNEWKKNHKPWDKLSKEEKKLKITLMSILGLLVIAGIFLLLLAQKGVI